MKTIVYRTLDQKILKDWQSLWEESIFANYTNSPQWFLSVIQNFHRKDFVILAVYEKDTLTAVAALMKEKKYGVDWYTVLPTDFVYGVPFLMDYTDKAVLTEVKEQLLSLGNIFLTNLPQKFASAVASGDRSAAAFYQTVNYYISLKRDSDGKTILRKRSKLLHEIRGKEDAFTLKSFDGKNEMGLKTVFAIDNQSRKQGRGYSAFASDKTQKFYEQLGKNFGKRFVTNVLYFTDTPIAYEIGFLINHTYFGSQIAYVAEYKQYSPGKVIMVKLADYLSARGVQTWDMGSGDSAVKKLVTEEKRELQQIFLTQNVLIRKYISVIITLRTMTFELLSRHKGAYTTYRKIKGILG
jgi:CelD/BcsL family acetyltransferase involved in cellulose biosynthesis